MKRFVYGDHCRIEVIILGENVVVPEPGKYVVQAIETEETWYRGFEDYEEARTFAAEDDCRFLYASTPELWAEAIRVNEAALSLNCLVESGYDIAEENKAKRREEAAQIAAENAELRAELKMLGIRTRY